MNLDNSDIRNCNYTGEPLELTKFRKEWFSDYSYIEARTSGSTGTPKKIFLLKENMRKSARRTMQFFGLGRKSYLYSCVSPEFIGGKMMAVRGWLYGSLLEFERPSSTPLAGKRFEHDEYIDLISVVPTQLRNLLEQDKVLQHIRNILVGGAPLSEDIREIIVEKGINVWESYGMTETCSHIALRKVDRERKPFTVLPGVEICTNKQGCLIINVDGVEVITNDIVELKPKGGFIVLGRSDNAIISGGKKLHPENIERRVAGWLKKVHGIETDDMAITSVPDDKWGEKCVLAISEFREEPNLTRLKEAGIIERWECPKEVVVVKEIPLTQNGKVNRPKLRQEVARTIKG